MKKGKQVNVNDVTQGEFIQNKNNFLHWNKKTLIKHLQNK